MTLYTQDPEPQEIDGSQLPATFGSVIGAAASMAFDELPLLSSIPKAVELDLARTRYAWTQPKYDAAGARSYVESQGLPSDWLEDKAYNKLELDILSRRKREELGRQDVMMRDDGGILSGSARLATALGVGMIDPLNVASAFIPVFSQERYAALLARQGSMLGRAGVRAGVGAVEGTVGAAVIEPLTYAVHQQEMADYSLADSALNIGFGSIFGASLHAGGGALIDLGDRARLRQVDRLITETVPASVAEASARAEDVPARAEDIPIADKGTEASAIAEARRVNTFTYDTGRGYGSRIGYPQQKGTPIEKLFSNFADQKSDAARLPEFRAKMMERAMKSPQQFSAERVVSEGVPFDGGMTARIDAAERGNVRVTVLDGDTVVAAARIEKGMIDSVAVSEAAKGRGIGADLLRFLDSHGIANIDEVPDRSPGFVSAQKAAIASRATPQRAAETVAGLNQTTRDALMRAAVAQAAGDQPIRLEGIAKLDTDRAAAPVAIRADAEHAARVENSPIADMGAVRAADEQLARVKSEPLAQATAEMDEAQALLADSLATLGDIETLPADIRAEIAAADQFSGEVESMNRAAAMLVQCALRHSV